jgi:hypothetical protein
MIAAGPSVIIVLVKGDVSGVRAGVKLRLSRMITSFGLTRFAGVV